MPTSQRCCCSVASWSVTSTPAMVMRPPSCGSRRFSARSSVDLPEPEAPMITVTSPWQNWVDTPFSTWCAPNDLVTRSQTM